MGEGRQARAGWLAGCAEGRRRRRGEGEGRGGGASNQSASGPLILHWRAGGTTAPGHSGSATRSTDSQERAGDGIEAQQLDETDTRRGRAEEQREKKGGKKPGAREPLTESSASFRCRIKPPVPTAANTEKSRKKQTHAHCQTPCACVYVSVCVIAAFKGDRARVAAVSTAPRFKRDVMLNSDVCQFAAFSPLQTGRCGTPSRRTSRRLALASFRHRTSPPPLPLPPHCHTHTFAHSWRR